MTTQVDNIHIQGNEHWTKKGDVKLFLWEKRRVRNSPDRGTIPISVPVTIPVAITTRIHGLVARHTDDFPTRFAAVIDLGAHSDAYHFVVRRPKDIR